MVVDDDFDAAAGGGTIMDGGGGSFLIVVICDMIYGGILCYYAVTKVVSFIFYLFSVVAPSSVDLLVIRRCNTMISLYRTLVPFVPY